ncbi:MAG: GrpB family protein [Gaiellaceae bacterium]
MSDEQIRAATVGELTPHAAPILLAEYDPEWPRLYVREEERIRAALGTRALQVEHVGSTSVPRLAAKPVIDVVLVVADSTDESSYLPDLEAHGYVLRIREPDWFEHRLLKGPDTNVNLHVFSSKCTEVQVMLDFRDWLRTHDDDRELYERAKRDLAGQDWKYVQNYADAKSAVVAEINTRAALRG